MWATDVVDFQEERKGKVSLTDHGISDHLAQLSSLFVWIQRRSKCLENQSIMHGGFDARPARTPFMAQVVLCPCPLNCPGGDSNFTIVMRYQANIASAVHLRNVGDLGFRKVRDKRPLPFWTSGWSTRQQSFK